MLRVLLPHGLCHEVLFKYDVIGGKRRDNNKCPICRSNDRERLLYFYFQNKIIPILENKYLTLLHIAPEPNFSKHIKKFKNILYKSGDKFETGYENSYEASIMDICDTKLENDSIDILICNHVLEHVNSYQVALNEIKRILKPNGKAILQVPIGKLLNTTIEDLTLKNNLEREEKFGQYDHVRLFGQDYDTILTNAGFKVIKYTSQELSNNQYEKFALNPDEIIFEVTK
jgi:SAM-dependent methyltransferase